MEAPALLHEENHLYSFDPSIASNGNDRFVHAVWTGDLETMMRMMTDGVDINARNRHGKTALIAACKRHQLEALRILLEDQRTDLNVSDEGDPRKVLEWAVAGCLCVLFEVVAARRLGIQSQIPLVLHSSCYAGPLEDLLCLANLQGVNWNLRDEDGWTPLHMAALARDPLFVSFIISMGVDVNARTRDDGDTALHIACRDRCVGTIKILLKHPRIDLSIQNYHGQTALEENPCWTSWEALHYLGDGIYPGQHRYRQVKDAFTSMPTRGGGKWHNACKEYPADMLVYLYSLSLDNQEPAQWNLGNYRRWTPLHTAVHHGKLFNVAFLLSQPQVNVNVKNRAGDTPLHLACGQGNLKICRLLLGHPTIDLSIRNKAGMTALDVTKNLDLHERAMTIQSHRLLGVLNTMLLHPATRAQPLRSKVATPMPGGCLYGRFNIQARVASTLAEKVIFVLSEWLTTKLHIQKCDEVVTGSGTKRKRFDKGYNYE